MKGAPKYIAALGVGYIAAAAADRLWKLRHVCLYRLENGQVVAMDSRPLDDDDTAESTTKGPA